MRGTVIKRRPFFRWIFIAGILVAIAISLLVARWTRNNTLEQLHQRAADDLKINIAYMESRIDKLFTLTRVVSSDERVLEMLDQPHNLEMIARVNRFLTRLDLTSGTLAYILNTEGVVIASGNWSTPGSFVGHNYSFRPYFKTALSGEPGQYVAIGVTSKHLGYYVALPIRKGNRIVAIAVTKTDPKDLVLATNRSNRPFIITDSYGVVIISNPSALQFHSLTQLSKTTIERLRHQHQYTGVAIKPLAKTPIENMGNVRVMTIFTQAPIKGLTNQKQYVVSATTVPTAGWTAHVLWPIHDLNSRIVQSLLLTFLALVTALLLALFAIQRWRYMKQLHQQAIRDPLTGLYTRLYMLESATSLLAAHDRNNIPGVGAIMFDLDHFKRINDQYGHSAGDNVLVQVAAIVLRECRDSDIPIRYGGEELLIFMPTGDEKQILHMAERVRMQIKKLGIALAGHRIHITLSGGIASHLVGESLEKLIDRADRMMYQAKQRGRDQIFWVPPSKDRSKARAG